MSILLDSLRKSEAQRKIKVPPSIHSAEEYGSERHRQRQWLALAMMGVTAAAIAWFGWQQFADPGRIGDAPAAAVAEEPAPGAETGTVEGQRSPSAPASQNGESRTPVERLSQSRETQPAAAPVTSPADRVAGFVAQEEAQAESADEPAAEELSEASEEIAIDEEVIGKEDLEDFTDVRPPQREPRGRTEPSGSEPRSYWQLPQSYRDELPELRITVLVYADAAEDRFLLINGERLREGDRMEGGVVLEEIRRDGAVFSYRQTRFLVKS